MGGKSKSSSNTTNQNFNVDERVAVDNGSTLYNLNVDGDGNTSNIVVSQTDLGAIEKAFDFANSNTDKSYNFASGALNFASETQGKAFQSLNDNTRLAFDFANNQAKSADERILSDITKVMPWIMGGIAILGSVYILRKGHKK